MLNQCGERINHSVFFSKYLIKHGGKYLQDLLFDAKSISDFPRPSFHTRPGRFAGQEALRDLGNRVQTLFRYIIMSIYT